MEVASSLRIASIHREPSQGFGPVWVVIVAAAAGGAGLECQKPSISSELAGGGCEGEAG